MTGKPFYLENGSGPYVFVKSLIEPYNYVIVEYRPVHVDLDLSKIVERDSVEWLMRPLHTEVR